MVCRHTRLFYWYLFYLFSSTGVKIEAEPQQLKPASVDPIEILKLCISTNASIESSSEEVFLGDNSFPSTTETSFEGSFVNTSKNSIIIFTILL